MTGPGHLEYRCRRCGVVERSTHAPNVLVAVTEIVALGRVTSWSGIPCLLLDTHRCADGGVGISDAIGGLPEPAERT